MWDIIGKISFYINIKFKQSSDCGYKRLMT